MLGPVQPRFACRLDGQCRVRDALRARGADCAPAAHRRQQLCRHLLQPRVWRLRLELRHGARQHAACDIDQLRRLCVPPLAPMSARHAEAFLDTSCPDASGQPASPAVLPAYRGGPASARQPRGSMCYTRSGLRSRSGAFDRLSLKKA